METCSNLKWNFCPKILGQITVLLPRSKGVRLRPGEHILAPSGRSGIPPQPLDTGPSWGAWAVPGSEKQLLFTSNPESGRPVYPIRALHWFGCRPRRALAAKASSGRGPHQKTVGSASIRGAILLLDPGSGRIRLTSVFVGGMMYSTVVYKCCSMVY